MGDAPALAASITARLDGGDWTLEIDGKPFPWIVSGDPGAVAGPVSYDGIPSLTITIPCDRLEILHAPFTATRTPLPPGDLPDGAGWPLKTDPLRPPKVDLVTSAVDAHADRMRPTRDDDGNCTTCGSAPGFAHDGAAHDRADDACQRFHPGQPCAPGQNHPAIGTPRPSEAG